MSGARSTDEMQKLTAERNAIADRIASGQGDSDDEAKLAGANAGIAARQQQSGLRVSIPNSEDSSHLFIESLESHMQDIDKKIAELKDDTDPLKQSYEELKALLQLALSKKLAQEPPELKTELSRIAAQGASSLVPSPNTFISKPTPKSAVTLKNKEKLRELDAEMEKYKLSPEENKKLSAFKKAEKQGETIPDESVIEFANLKAKKERLVAIQKQRNKIQQNTKELDRYDHQTASDHIQSTLNGKSKCKITFSQDSRLYFDATDTVKSASTDFLSALYSQQENRDKIVELTERTADESKSENEFSLPNVSFYFVERKENGIVTSRFCLIALSNKAKHLSETLEIIARRLNEENAGKPAEQQFQYAVLTHCSDNFLDFLELRKVMERDGVEATLNKRLRLLDTLMDEDRQEIIDLVKGEFNLDKAIEPSRVCSEMPLISSLNKMIALGNVAMELDPSLTVEFEVGALNFQLYPFAPANPELIIGGIGGKKASSTDVMDTISDPKQPFCYKTRACCGRCQSYKKSFEHMHAKSAVPLSPFRDPLVIEDQKKFARRWSSSEQISPTSAGRLGLFFPDNQKAGKSKQTKKKGKDSQLTRSKSMSNTTHQ